MSYLTRLSLQLGAVVMIVVVILFAGGVWAATQLKQDLLPDISFPAYVVIVPYPGAGPGVVDTQVTQPLGAALQTVSGVSHVNSTSSQGASIVEVQFNDGVDPSKAQQDVNTAVDKVRPALPTATKAPTVQAFSTDQLPILQYSVVADEPLDQLAGQLNSIAVPKLKGLAGVSSVQVAGGATQEVQVAVDPARLAAHGLTMAQVGQALQSASLVQSVGTVQDGGHTVPVQVASTLTSLDAIRQVPIPAPGRPPVKVGDVASVGLAAVPSDTITRTDGKPSIGLNVLKTPSANTVQVANQVKDALPGIRGRIGHGVQLTAMQDNATPVTDAIGSILREGLLGALFAVIVIFAFLRSLRATVVAAVSIPLSLLVALLVLWWQNITLNILTLGGMTVAIGRVVDDAIVVLENISRHVQGGRPPRRAALSGAREIVTAVTSSTLTTVAVFLPIAFLSGIAGQFFRPFALTVVTALLASLLVAVTVVPLFASRLLKPPRRPGVDRVAEVLQRAYVPAIRWATGHRLLTVLVALALLAGSLALVPRLRVNLLDQSSQPTFTVSLTMPENSTLAQTDAEVQRVEGMVKSVPDVKAYQATVGGSADPFAPPGTVPADPTTATILVLVDKQNHARVQSDVQRMVDTYSGPAKVSVGAARSSSSGTSSGVQLSVTAPNAASLQTADDRVLAALGKVDGLRDVKSNLAASKPQYVLMPTPALASSGLTLQSLAALVAQAVGGQVATQATLPQGQVDVRVQLPAGTAGSPQALRALPVPTPAGMVPLATLATLDQTQGPQSVLRVDGNQTATITATMTGNDTRVVQQRVNSALGGVKLPDGASVSTGGVFDQLNTVLNQFILAILGAIALVYLIMVATFRSLLKPLVLLVSIPFAAIGAILALVLTDTALSLPGLIGLLMLIGIVVTNAIVLLDLVEQYRERGMNVQEALIEGGRHRLRPILMTAIATMLALIPMALGGDTGGGFIGAPLAIVVIGGLCSSTLLTLLLVPVLYSVVARFTRSRSANRVEQSDDDREPVGAPVRARAEHPLVTVFAAAGLAPEPIAAQVAERLRVPLLDLGGGVDQIATALAPALATEDSSRGALTQLLSRLGAASDSDDRSAFQNQLRETVLRLGTRAGGVVVSPIGAVVLSDRPGGLHVRLVAPMERRLAGARQAGESEEETRRRLERIDADRESAVRDTYGIDLNDPRLYQLTLDPTVFPLDASVELIATAAETALREPAPAPASAPAPAATPAG